VVRGQILGVQVALTATEVGVDTSPPCGQCDGNLQGMTPGLALITAKPPNNGVQPTSEGGRHRELDCSRK